MIRASFFYQELAAYGINFYTGVPDSLLKNLCAYVTDHADHHIIAANEGGAMGIAAGHYLATGQIPVVYMQNSGEGNIINPLASLVDKEVYNIPVLLVIGWRGKPGSDWLARQAWCSRRAPACKTGQGNPLSLRDDGHSL